MMFCSTGFAGFSAVPAVTRACARCATRARPSATDRRRQGKDDAHSPYHQDVAPDRAERVQPRAHPGCVGRIAHLDGRAVLLADRAALRVFDLLARERRERDLGMMRARVQLDDAPRHDDRRPQEFARRLRVQRGGDQHARARDGKDDALRDQRLRLLRGGAAGSGSHPVHPTCVTDRTTRRSSTASCSDTSRRAPFRRSHLRTGRCSR